VMSREKRLFSIGSARNATCAISKQWAVSIWPTTRWLSLNWRRSLAEKFTRAALRYRKEENDDETVCAKNRAVNHARCASFWRCVVLEEQRHGESEQDRLLDLHDASFGARKGTREMSHLFDGSCPGHERKHHPGGLE